MIVERAEHPTWTSNAYLVAEGEGGSGVLIDSNGVEQPLLDLVEQKGITITHVLVTHQHMDHVVDVTGLARRFGVQVVGGALTKDAGVPIEETIGDGDVVQSGGLEIKAIATPGHCPDHTALLVNGTDLYPESDDLADYPVHEQRTCHAFHTADYMKALFPHAQVLPPVNTEMQHCCIIRR